MGILMKHDIKSRRSGGRGRVGNTPSRRNKGPAVFRERERETLEMFDEGASKPRDISRQNSI